METTLQNHCISIIREAMQTSNLTQSAISEILGATRQTVANILTGRTELTLNTFETLAGAVGLAVDQIINTYRPAGHVATTTGNRNQINQAGGNVTSAETVALETEIKYLRELLSEKNEQIKLYKTIIDNK